MPTKKQRRRRLKSQRHEYEIVYVDAEGNEVEPPPEDAGASHGKTKRAAQPVRSRRAVQPPSWRRVGKRGLLFAPVMFLLMTFLEPDTAIVQRLFFTAQLLLIFLPFSYLMDRLTFRLWQRRVERERTAGAAAKSS